MTAENPQDELPLQTLAEFQQAHEALLDHYDAGDAQASEQARLVPIIAEVRAFLRRGAAGGAYLFESRERRSAQGMLDYWASLCYGTQLDIERAVLAPHDPDKLPRLNDDDCPYVGLEAFGKSNAINFFGRTERVQAVLQRFESDRLVVVTGSSGSGKSSLVLAGVQPALMEGGVPGSAQWRYPPALVPGATPLDNLVAAIAPGQGDAPAKALLAEPASLAGLLGDTPTLLVIDQFEEVMTLRTDDNAPAFGAFVAALLALLDDPHSPHRLLLTMRSDVDTLLAREYPEFNRRYARSVFPLVAMDAAQLRQAIEAPAQRVGLKFQNGLVDELVRSVVGEDAGLPLLQFSLMTLWDRRHGNLITLDMLREVGSPRRAMTLAAERRYQLLNTEQQLAAREMFLVLSRQGEGATVFRNRVTRRRLHEVADRPTVDRVIELFVRDRLLRLTPREPSSEDLVEVAHEALLRNWERLQTLFEERRAERERLAFLRKQALKWRESNFDKAYLLSGLALKEAQTETAAGRLGDNERSFIERSEEVERELAVEQAAALARERRNNRRTKAWMGAALTLTLALAWVFGQQYWQERSKSLRVKADQSIKDARSLLGRDPTGTWNLLSKVSQDYPDLTTQAASVYVDSLNFRWPELTVAGPAGDNEGRLASTVVSLNMSGDMMLTVDRSEWVEWSIERDKAKPSRRRLAPPEVGRVYFASYVPGSRKIALASRTGVWLWQGKSEPVRISPPNLSEVTRLDVSDDGQWLAALSDVGKRVSIWRLTDDAAVLALDHKVARKAEFVGIVNFDQEAQRLYALTAMNGKDDAFGTLIFERRGDTFSSKPKVQKVAACRPGSPNWAAGGSRFGFMLRPGLCTGSLAVTESAEPPGPNAADVEPVLMDEVADDILFAGRGQLMIRLVRRGNEVVIEDLESRSETRLQGAFDLPPLDSYEHLVSVSGNRERLAIRGKDGAVKVYGLGAAMGVASFRGKSNQFAEDDRLLLARLPSQQGLGLYDIESGRRQSSLPQVDLRNDIAFSLDTPGMAHLRMPCKAPSKGEQVVSFDVRTDIAVHRHASECADLIEARHGHFYLLNRGKFAEVYSAASGKVIFRREFDRPAKDLQLDDANSPGIALAANGRILLKEITSKQPLIIKLTTLRIKGDGPPELEKDIPVPPDPNGIMVALQADGRLLLMGTEAGISFVDLDHPELKRFETPWGTMTQYSDAMLALRNESEESWRLHKIGSWQEAGKLPADAKFAGNGLVHMHEGDEWKLYELADMSKPLVSKGGRVDAPRFDAKGQTVALKMVGTDRIQVVDVKTGKVRLEAAQSAVGRNYRLSPGGRYLLAEDGRLIPSDATAVMKSIQRGMCARAAMPAAQCKGVKLAQSPAPTPSPPSTSR